MLRGFYTGSIFHVKYNFLGREIVADYNSECLIFICDDEPQILEDIKANVRQIFKEAVIHTFTDGNELLGSLQKKNCDILLLDIDMPGTGGLDVAGSLASREPKPLLVFVTSHDELVYDSLQFHPFGFVRKNFLHEELVQVLKDCKSEIDNRDKKDEGIFRFRMANAQVQLYYKEILYFESDGNYLKIFTNDREYRFRNTLTAVENALEGDGFIRIHKGFLVNQAAIRILTAEEAELINGSRIPIGRSYVESVRKSFMRYMM